MSATINLATADDLVALYTSAGSLHDLDLHWLNTEHDRHVLELAHWRRVVEAHHKRRARFTLANGLGEIG